MKSEKVSKEVKNSKKVKVADLPKGKKKTTTSSLTGFSRGMGLFFIGIIGILAGLLLFNMIVHFGVNDIMEENFLAQSLSAEANGKSVKTETFTPEAATAFYFSFDHASTSTVSYFNKGGDAFGMYVISGTPQFSPEGIAVTPVVAFEFSRDSVDDTVTKLLKKGGTSKKVTIDSTDGVEITNPGENFTYLVFKNKNVVYAGKFSTEQAYLAEANNLSNHIKSGVSFGVPLFIFDSMLFRSIIKISTLVMRVLTKQ